MNPTIAGLLVFVCASGAAILGMYFRRTLLNHELSADSRDTVRLGIGMVSTIAALVLGLVTASAKSSFDTVDAAIETSAEDALILDRLLARYGPETRELRSTLKGMVARRVDMIWPSGSTQPAQLDPWGVMTVGEGIAEQVRALTPSNDAQRVLRARAMDVAERLLEERWIVSANSGASVPVVFLVIIILWLAVTFASFGLLATHERAVHAVLHVSALCVGSAVFLILEMDGPFDGVLRASAEPLRYALEHLNR
jgi:hypothetical protein